MPVGDVWELSLIAEMQGQPIMSVFHYETTAEPSGEIDGSELIVAWSAGPLQTEWLLNFAGQYVLQAYRAQRIYNGDTSSLSKLPPVQVLANVTGTLGADPVPSLNTGIVFYNTLLGPDEVFFSGKKLIPVGNEVSTNDGQLDPSLIATLTAFMDRLVEALDTGSGNIVQFGVWSQQRAEFLDPTVILPVSLFSIRLNQGALRRRKRGTARSGFQP